LRDLEQKQPIIGINESSLLRKEFNYVGLNLLYFWLLFLVYLSPLYFVAFLANVDADKKTLIILMVSSMLALVLLVEMFFLLRTVRIKNEVTTLLENGEFYTLEEYIMIDGIKNHNKRNYSIAALGDFGHENSFQPLIDILLSTERIPWSTRKITAYALAKYGTYEAVDALFQALILYKIPTRTMSNRSRYESFHRFRATRAVKLSLKRLAEINGFQAVEEMWRSPEPFDRLN